MNRNANSMRRPHRAFTLLEMLVVVAVIALLAAAVLTVGRGIIGNQEISKTRNLVATLDRALADYHSEVGTFPKYRYELYEEIPGNGGHDPIMYNGDEFAGRPEAGVFIEQASGFGEVDGVLQAIPEAFMATEVVLNDRTIVRIVDSWENVVFYVHPQNQVAQALFGRCQNDKPYFFSAGPDGKYGRVDEVDDPALSGAEQQAAAEGYIEDNIYSSPVGPFERNLNVR